MPKRNTHHNHGDFFWTKQTGETPEELWKRLFEIGKECNFNITSTEVLLMSKFVTASPIKSTGQINERKNTGTEEGN